MRVHRGITALLTISIYERNHSSGSSAQGGSGIDLILLAGLTISEVFRMDVVGHVGASSRALLGCRILYSAYP